MLLKLENIGMIKEASVKLDGLTIIAGENDTGKSTVAKLMFFFQQLIKQKFELSDFSLIRKKILYSIFESFDIFQQNSRWDLKLIINDNMVVQGSKWEIPIKFDYLKNLINNVIFIDTPDILTKVKYINEVEKISEKFFLPYQTKDLILKLSQNIITSKNNELYKKISEIIHGEVYYDSNRDDFYFKKENLEKEINIHNTSNGIKMFGLLQILIANETIKENSILILDEPEVHLHPKWQLKYAEIIVELVKSGVIVLVTSHSPYIVEALKVYSDKENLEGKTNFYLAESEDGVSSTIKDVTSDLSIVFEKLTEPLEELNNYSFEN